MSSYETLAESYDLFTTDVDYKSWADYYEEIFKRFGLKPKLVLDLACGTGTLSIELAKRGYDMTAVDASYDMLAQAMQKAEDLENKPLFLCQDMEELDLYGTMDAVVCALDSLNYLLSVDSLNATFDRLKYFVRPGGLVIFDVNTEFKFKKMDGMSYIRDEKDHFCAWSAEYSDGICRMTMDIFDRVGNLWNRSEEEHIERAHSDEEIENAFSKAGFKLKAKYDELSFEEANYASERVFWVIERE